MRVLKLAQSWTTMKVLLSIIISTLGALGNLTFLLIIVIYIFAVLGMQLFGNTYTDENFYPDKVPRYNFYCDMLPSSTNNDNGLSGGTSPTSSTRS